MKKIIIAAVVIILISCNKNKKIEEKGTQIFNNTIEKNKYKQKQEFVMLKDSVKIMPFTIEINLSDKATEFFNGNKESLALLISFSGTPKKNGLPKNIRKGIKPNGLLYFPNIIKEINNVKQFNIITITDISFSKEYYNALIENKALHIKVNIMNGQGVLKNNILDGEVLNTSFNSVLSNETYFNLSARLINESKNATINVN